MLSPNFSPFPELTTERLLLRRFTMADGPCIHRMRSNPDVMRYINRPLTVTLADAELWIKTITDALDNNEGITWSMCIRENPGECIGSVGLWRIEKHNHRAEIGYLMSPDFQGRGLMREAVLKVLEYGFRDILLHSIEGRIDPRNHASATVLIKSGFELEGHFKESCYDKGEFSDSAIYSIRTPLRNVTGSAGR